MSSTPVAAGEIGGGLVTTEDRQREFIAGAVSLGMAGTVFIAAAVVIALTVHPETESLRREAMALTMVTDFAPEPVERLLYLLAMIFFPPALLAGYWSMTCLLKREDAAAVGRLYRKTVLVASGAGALFVLSSLGLLMPSRTNFHSYFDLSILVRHPWLYTLFLWPASLFIFIKYHTAVSLRVISFCFLFAALLAIPCMDLFGLHGVDDSVPFSYHMNPAFYPLAQLAGAPAGAAEGGNLYGHYSYFLLPLFRILGADTLAFSALMTLLIVAGFILLFMAVRPLVRAPAMLYLGGTAVVYYGYLYGKIVTGDMYFQYHPVRFLFPALILFTASRYFLRPRPALYYCIFSLGLLGILWNTETGLCALGAWGVALLFHEAWERPWRRMAGRILMHLLTAFTFLAVGGGLFIYGAYLRGGRLSGLMLILEKLKLFYRYDYMMLKMPLLHPWAIIALVYLAAFLYAARCLVGRTDRYRATMVLLLGTLGTALFSYYVGRSHDWSLWGPVYPALLLILVGADSALGDRTDAPRRLSHQAVLLGAASCFLFSAPFSLLLNVPEISPLAHQRLGSLFKTTSETARTVSFIRGSVKPGEAVLILSGNQSVYYAESGTYACLLDACLTEIFYRKEYEDLERFIRTNSRYKVFYDLRLYTSPSYSRFRPLMDLLKQYYRIADTSPDQNMVLLARKPGAPTAPSHGPS